MNISKGGILVCLIFSVLVFFSSCNKNEGKQKINIEQEEYVLKFEISNTFEKYLFMLTPEKGILAQYTDSDSNFEQLSVYLDDYFLLFMNQYIDDVLNCDDSELSGNVNFTCFWHVNFYMNEKVYYFDYGACKNNSVNILIEQIIGCCDFEKANEEELLPVGAYNRKLFRDYLAERQP